MTLIEPERDALGRYLIDGRPHERVTEILRVLQDHATNQRWNARRIISGLLEQPDLLDTSSRIDDIDRTIDQALTIAGANTPARIGTEIHEQTALHDTGQEIVRWREVVDAYKRGLEDHQITTFSDLVERTVVYPHDNDGINSVAGTFDRIVEHEGRLMVADIKTGKHLDWLLIGAQLAAYAHAPWMLAADGGLDLKPAVDLSTGLVLHLPANGAPITVWEVDLWSARLVFEAACDLHFARKVHVGRNQLVLS